MDIISIRGNELDVGGGFCRCEIIDCIYLGIGSYVC